MVDPKRRTSTLDEGRVRESVLQQVHLATTYKLVLKESDGEKELTVAETPKGDQIRDGVFTQEEARIILERSNLVGTGYAHVKKWIAGMSADALGLPGPQAKQVKDTMLAALEQLKPPPEPPTLDLNDL